MSTSTESTKGKPKAKPKGNGKGKPQAKPKGNGKTPSRPKAVATPPPAEDIAVDTTADESLAFPVETFLRPEDMLDASYAFKLASDKSRLAIMVALSRQFQLNVGQLCVITGLTQPAVSHHLSLMRHARLVTTSRNGKNVNYRTTDAGRKIVKAAEIIR